MGASNLNVVRAGTSRTTNRRRLFLTLSAASLLFATLTWWTIPSWRSYLPGLVRDHSSTLKHGNSLPCQDRSNQVKATHRNIWADLDDDEVADLTALLYDSDKLNLTRASHATQWDNHIALIETLVPNKTDALRYLDIKSHDLPDRYARVIIAQGSEPQATIDQYMIGPLPVTNATRIEPLTFIYNSGRSYIETPMTNYADLSAWFLNLGQEAGDFVRDLIGVDADSDFEIAAMAQSPVVLTNSIISNWISVHSPGARADAWSLLPQGLYVRFEVQGREKKDWHFKQWYYNGVLYNSTDAIRSAWKNGKIQKLPINRDGHWTDSEPEEKGLSERDSMPAPVMVIPGGKRWKVDESEHFISWMGFEFYYSVTRSRAMSLWDIRFGGERIMYELGLQEAMAHYAGNDPMSIGMVWLDTLFGMGVNMYELVPGYDCPAYATYLDTAYHQSDSTVTRKNSVCIFEYTADHAIQRHTTGSHVTVSRNTYLIVRSVSTVGNYDYTIDYTFYLDGSIEVKVRASGYIFGAYHQLEGLRHDLAKRSDLASYEYGYQIQDFVVSSMHDHVLNFKADLDIAGTANTLTRVDVAPTTYQYPWDESERSTMRLVHTHYLNETGLTWPPNSAAMYVVMNNETTNKWGEKRGYKIVPGTGMGTPPHLTIVRSPWLGKAAAWALKDLFVVKHHDEERGSASEYNSMVPEDPLIDFGKMVNGEGIVQDDLVVYFNLGTHHVPHSGDVPNTLMHTSSSSVMFIPHNFHDRDPSRKSSQGAKLTLDNSGEGKAPKIQYYGAQFTEDTMIKKNMLEPDLRNYSRPEGSITYMLWNATLAAL